MRRELKKVAGIDRDSLLKDAKKEKVNNLKFSFATYFNSQLKDFENVLNKYFVII